MVKQIVNAMMHKNYLILFLLVISLMSGYDVKAQANADSLVTPTPLKKEKKGSIFSGRPGKSMLMSLVIPGAGQIYNKSYLRVPFVYAAVGGMGYVLHYNTRQYNCLKEAYIAVIDGVDHVPQPYCDERIAGIKDPRRLKLLRDQANADRQLAIVGFSLVWLANGIDAFVNAHLKDFDMDENLSFEFGTRTDDDPFVPVRTGLFVQF